MASVPRTGITHRSPPVLFSLLRPSAHISPHNGLINSRLLAHLPLIVPGKVWPFDDTIKREARNDLHETRVILRFDVSRPGTSEDEHRLISEIFDAIDSHTATDPEWEI